MARCRVSSGRAGLAAALPGILLLGRPVARSRTTLLDRDLCHERSPANSRHVLAVQQRPAPGRSERWPHRRSRTRTPRLIVVPHQLKNASSTPQAQQPDQTVQTGTAREHITNDHARERLLLAKHVPTTFVGRRPYGHCMKENLRKTSFNREIRRHDHATFRTRGSVCRKQP